MKILLLILGLIAILSCTTKKGTETNNRADTIKYDTPIKDSYTGQKAVMAIDTVLYKSESLHYFSSTTDKDSFQIIVTGRSIKSGQFRFQITTKAGQVILDESYEATLLLGYGLKANPTENDKEEYIKTRIDNFLNEDKFHQPAISKNDTFDEDYGKKEIWDDIISDQTAVGFYYLLGEEDGRQIAFSKKLGKVVLYYNCC